MTLCEACFPHWKEVEVLTVPAMTPCGACGKYEPHKRHVFRGDPRTEYQERGLGDKA